MGRPHINDQEKRVVQVNIRLTTAEYKKVSDYAVASGLSPANWIRKKIFTGKFPAVKESPIESATYHELKKIGVNINQATHKLNQGEMEKDYLLFVLQVRNLLERTLKALLNDRQSGKGQKLSRGTEIQSGKGGEG